MRVARWAEPHVKEWHRKRHLNRVEGQRHLDSRNWSEAEKHFTLALAERRHSNRRRCELLLNLEHAQRRQKKLAEAEQSALAALEAAARTRAGRCAPARKTRWWISNSSRLDTRKPCRASSTFCVPSMPDRRPDGARVAKCYRKLGNCASQERIAPRRPWRHSARRLICPSKFSAAATARPPRVSRNWGCFTASTAITPRRNVACGARSKSIARPQDWIRTRLRKGLYHLAASLEESGDLDGAAGEFERLLGLRARQVGVNPVENAETEVRLAGTLSESRAHGAGQGTAESRRQRVGAPGRAAAGAGSRDAGLAEEQSGRPDEAKRWREVASNLVIATGARNVVRC